MSFCLQTRTGRKNVSRPTARKGRAHVLAALSDHDLHVRWCKCSNVVWFARKWTWTHGRREAIDLHTIPCHPYVHIPSPRAHAYTAQHNTRKAGRTATPDRTKRRDNENVRQREG